MLPRHQVRIATATATANDTKNRNRICLLHDEILSALAMYGSVSARMCLTLDSIRFESVHGDQERKMWITAGNHTTLG
jgi:hypothetical protein